MPQIWSNSQVDTLDVTQPTQVWTNTNTSWVAGANQWPVVPTNLGGSTNTAGVLGMESLSALDGTYDAPSGLFIMQSGLEVSATSTFTAQSPIPSFTINILFFDADGNQLPDPPAAIPLSFGGTVNRNFATFSQVPVPADTAPDPPVLATSFYCWVEVTVAGSGVIANAPVTVTITAFGGLAQATQVQLDIPGLPYAGRPVLDAVVSLTNNPSGAIRATGFYVAADGTTELLHELLFLSQYFISKNLVQGGTATIIFNRPIVIPSESIIGMRLIDFNSREINVYTLPKVLIDQNNYEYYASFSDALSYVSISGTVSNINPASVVEVDSQPSLWSYDANDKGYSPQRGVFTIPLTIGGQGINLPADGTEVIVLPGTLLPPTATTMIWRVSGQNQGSWDYEEYIQEIPLGTLSLFLKTNTDVLIEFTSFPVSFKDEFVFSHTIDNPDTSIFYQISASVTDLLPAGIVSPYYNPSPALYFFDSVRNGYEATGSLIGFIGVTPDAFALVGTGTSFTTDLTVGESILISPLDFSDPFTRNVATIIDDTHLTVDVAFTTSFSGLIETSPLGQITPPSFSASSIAQTFSDAGVSAGQFEALAFGVAAPVDIVTDPFVGSGPQPPSGFMDPFTTGIIDYSTGDPVQKTASIRMMEIYPDSTSCFCTGLTGHDAFPLVNPELTATFQGPERLGIGYLGIADIYAAATITPVSIDPAVVIVKVVTNGRNSLFLTADGSVYSSGIGHGSTDALLIGYNVSNFLTTGAVSLPKPYLIPVLANLVDSTTGNTGIVDIAIGNAGALALDSLGQVWAWGSNTSRQLGLGEVTNIVDPVITATGVRAIATGPGGTSAIITLDGQVQMAGSNRFGMTGQGVATGLLSTWTPVVLSGNALKVHCGLSETLFVMADGTLFGCGRGTGAGAYALGAGPVLTDSDPLTPIVIPDFGGGIVEAVSRATNFLSLSAIGSTTWVRNLAGQMLFMGPYNAANGSKGDGTVDGVSPQATPSQVLLPTVLAADGVTEIVITCGKLSNDGDTACIGSDGLVYVWGSNEAGVFGIGSIDSDPHPTPQAIPGTINAGQLATALNTMFPTPQSLGGLIYCQGALVPPVANLSSAAQVIG